MTTREAPHSPSSRENSRVRSGAPTRPERANPPPQGGGGGVATAVGFAAAVAIGGAVWGVPGGGGRGRPGGVAGRLPPRAAAGPLGRPPASRELAPRAACERRKAH